MFSLYKHLHKPTIPGRLLAIAPPNIHTYTLTNTQIARLRTYEQKNAVHSHTIWPVSFSRSLFHTPSVRRAKPRHTTTPACTKIFMMLPHCVSCTALYVCRLCACLFVCLVQTNNLLAAVCVCVLLTRQHKRAASGDATRRASKCELELMFKPNTSTPTLAAHQHTSTPAHQQRTTTRSGHHIKRHKKGTRTQRTRRSNVSSR